ncbi:MAG TPA: rhomboid family intramembrane serine protease [Pseudonocardia sp.]|jgi:membrane associated rhomboid family serine protease|uniref:rhomboid family intramembrane serine protease n=1 Tax=Pseudonocardia sp. TaxID=60912 RepID=UPI002F41625D
MATSARPYRPRTSARVFPRRPFMAAFGMLLFTFLLYLVEAYDQTTSLALNDEDGIVARDPSHLVGVVWAPLLHSGWPHLESNAPFFLIFGFLVLAGGLRQFIAVTAVIWVVSGLGVWLIAPPGSVTVGASGVIFGWLVFLLFRGFFSGSLKQILLAVVLFLLWGGVLVGLLPGDPHVSWQAHLFGALAGILCARMVASADRSRAIRSREPVIRQ